MIITVEKKAKTKASQTYLAYAMGRCMCTATVERLKDYILVNLDFGMESSRLEIYPNLKKVHINNNDLSIAAVSTGKVDTTICYAEQEVKDNKVNYYETFLRSRHYKAYPVYLGAKGENLCIWDDHKLVCCAERIPVKKFDGLYTIYSSTMKSIDFVISLCVMWDLLEFDGKKNRLITKEVTRSNKQLLMYNPAFIAEVKNRDYYGR